MLTAARARVATADEGDHLDLLEALATYLETRSLRRDEVSFRAPG